MDRKLMAISPQVPPLLPDDPDIRLLQAMTRARINRLAHLVRPTFQGHSR